MHLCIGPAKTTYTRGRGVGVWRLLVEMGPRRDLRRPYPRQYAGARQRFPIGEDANCTDNAVRTHSSGPSLLAQTWMRRMSRFCGRICWGWKCSEACIADAHFVNETFAEPLVLLI